ncbi:uncharacterized protein AB675_9153 [Cyphellophora attinorum]|uniref:Uncharacterized protein n=1 Tax=Cyphellophora attinorum TaxID=1664694 RepID=A0A0N1HBR3_9EURO|nr:uncharacterized protein AB675_9153 [Phialophora attinorum]KPI41553.1 hypothetical protein AB675_9153 [Phialophora attinorum]
MNDSGSSATVAPATAISSIRMVPDQSSASAAQQQQPDATSHLAAGGLMPPPSSSDLTPPSPSSVYQSASNYNNNIDTEVSSLSSEGEADAANAPHGRKSITITRTLDVESVSTTAGLTPTKSASMEPLSTYGGSVNHYFAGPATSNGHQRGIRSVNSVGSLLPSIPKMSAIDLSRPVELQQHQPMRSRPSTAAGVADAQQREPSPPPVPQSTVPKLPPFRQSKRWARTYMCGDPSPSSTSRPRSQGQPGHERVISEEDRPMTLREASFEQQRAIWKHAAAMPSDTQPPVPVLTPAEAGAAAFSQSREIVTLREAVSTAQPQQQIQPQQSPGEQGQQPSDSPRKPHDDTASIATSAAAQSQGLCRPLSLPSTWQLVRASRAGRSSSSSTGNVFRKLTLHRSTGTTKHHRQHKRKSSGDPRATIDNGGITVGGPATVGIRASTSRSSQLPRKRAMSDLRKRAAGVGGSTAVARRPRSPPQPHRRRTPSPFKRLRTPAVHNSVAASAPTDIPAVEESQRPSARPASPVPSLHDPEKAKRFSEECEEMLSNSNFEKDFISPSVPVSRSPTDASKQGTAAAAGGADGVTTNPQASQMGER